MFRCVSGSDLDLVLSCSPVDPTGFIDGDRFRREFAEHLDRFERTWILEDRGRLQARALWWGSADQPHPAALDCLWVHPSAEHPDEMAAGLLSAGHASLRQAGATRLPDYHLDLPNDWRDDPAAVNGVTWRQRAAAAHGFDIQAGDDLRFYLGLAGRRDRWRLAYDGAGSMVGLIIASRSAYDPSVSYLGVVPEARGRGYVHDFVAEITHLHLEDGAERIKGTTDTTNLPMAAAFRRAGYAQISTRLVLSEPPS